MNLIQSREELMQALESEKIFKDGVLNALRQVSREDFVELPLKPFAYKNAPLAIGFQQTISQPYLVALMTQLLDLKPGLRVLEIGTGSGYQAAVLSVMGVFVDTVERIRPLYEKAFLRLESFQNSVHCFYGDGMEGVPSGMIYDRILVTAAFEQEPVELESRINRENGVILYPLGGEWEIQRLIRVTYQKGIRKVCPGDFCRFVPIKKGLMEL